MYPSIIIRLCCIALALGLCGLSGLAVAQTPPLIYACVDAQGRVRIIPDGGSCGPRETLLTWPAGPAGGVTYYERSAAAKLLTLPMTVVALCDAPEDTATGGGYRWERDPASSLYSSCWVEASASCRASGLCGGATGEDGWAVTAWSCAHPSQAPVLHVYVTCASQLSE